MPLPIQFYNSLTHTLEPFEPLEAGKVKLYVCGPTVYDEAHLGHARCYITWDVLYRFLEFAGYDVTYARNITDVDDKIINRAKEANQTASQLATHFTQRFHKVMETLNVLPPTVEPKATAHIPHMIALIETLIQKQMAYSTQSGVYFDVQRFPQYGNLCHQNLDDLQSGARVEVDTEKRSPLDFALWKRADDSETVKWDSPWEAGRPGWHIECSAMNQAVFGDQIDIHAGGMDLIFPHHQNEIAQSEAASGKAPFAKYWLHNGFVNVSGEKMSKSLGNFSTIEKLLERYDANTIRYFILTNHYRSPMDFKAEALDACENWVKNVREKATRLISKHQYQYDSDAFQDYRISVQTMLNDNVVPELAGWVNSMANDLNTAKALDSLNYLIQKASDNIQYLEMFQVLAEVMGFTPKLTPLRTIDLGITLGIDAMVKARELARQEKNWAESDRIRNELAARGIKLEDNPDGTTTVLSSP